MPTELLSKAARVETGERQQIEDALRLSDERFRQLTGNIQEVFWLMDIATQKLIYVSAAYEKLWGRTCESLYASPEPWPDSIHPDDLDRVRHVVTTSLPTGTYDETFRIVRPDDTIRWIRERAFPVRNADGKIYRIAGVAEDTTRQKGAEEELRSSEGKQRTADARYRTMLQSMLAGVIVRAADAQVTAFNAKAAALLGLTEAQMTARVPFDADWGGVRADGTPLLDGEMPYQVAMATRRPVREFTVGFHRADTHEQVWLQMNANPVLTAQGTIAEVIETFMDVTNRIVAEQAVRDGAKFTEDVLNSLTAHVVVLDEHGIIIAVNEAWRRFARENGAGEIHFVGLSYFTACISSARADHAIEAGAAVAGIRGVIEGKLQNFTLEYPCDAPTQKRWFRMSVEPLRGALRGVVVSHQDITEAKQAATDLQWKTAFLEAQVSASPDGVLVVDQSGKKILQNQRMTELFQIPADVAADSDDRRQLSWVTERTRYPKAFAERVAHLTAHPAEIGHDEVELKDGSVLDRYSSPVLGKRSRNYGRIWTFRDITGRKRAEETLRASEKRFKALFEQAAVGVAQADAATGRFVQVNQRFCDLVDRSREKLERTTFAAITHPDDVGASMDVVRRIKAGLIRESSAEKRYIRGDGSEIWAEVTVSAMWAPGDPPDFFIAVVQDITGRKRLEEHVRQSQKMEAVGTLAGGIAHDFNNILAAVTGYTELAQLLLKDNPKVREYLNGILKASTRAKDLVRQILAFSRQQRLERRPINLESVVSESVKLLRATIPSTIAFETSLDADTPIVLADASQVHQIMMNLGTNAWHAMKDRPGRFQVKLEKCVIDGASAVGPGRLRPGIYTRLSIGDNGSGMDESTLRQMFHPFFTTKPPGEGTGLGLAVVHGIMESHDGVVTVSSHLGEGTTFQLYFPAHDGTELVATTAPSQTPRGQGERILVVDDEEVLGLLCQETLESLGYQVEATTQPEAALAMVRVDPKRFALVLTDQTMPGMTGLVLARQIQVLRAGLPIILMTGYNLGLTPARAAAEGVHQLLVKPISIHDLGTAVHAALAGQISQ